MSKKKFIKGQSLIYVFLFFLLLFIIPVVIWLVQGSTHSVRSIFSNGYNQGIVTVTFDDGVESQYTHAFPILQKYSIPATFYITTGFLDEPFYLSTKQLKYLKAANHQIAAHTLSHPPLTELNTEELEKELLQPKRELEELLGVPVEDFAAPYGATNEHALQVIRKYYRSHRSVLEGYNTKDNFTIDNIVVQNVLTTTTREEVSKWIMNTEKDRSWLVLVYHQIDNPSDDYSVTSLDFAEHMKMIKESKLQPLTLDRALEELLPQMESN